MSALSKYREQEPGWYVVNPRTDIAVAYFQHEEGATAEAARRNAKRSIAPDPLIVKRVDQVVDF